ncbi:MAG: RluA family pseudouridine synthase [Anaerolineae bacterium]|jgi:23S rRNA pseudouridine1911/1915/1917 synthase|nr:RluA family pseudouridine synthase [Anaerolineae bacterium]MBT7075962.1 RluA family pseudouridine synthase [Anaerolineae bacterium]MBT7783638.1 RluA family pseudouridine synthase [Anaerolineae bacterium]
MSSQFVKLRYSAEKDARLDHFLVQEMSEFTRSRLQGIIAKKLVTVDGEIITKNGTKISAGALVIIEIPAPKGTDLVPENIPLDIIFENDDVLVVSKEAGMVVHPSAGHDSGTLVHAALAHAPEMEGIGGEIRPGVVHRLDKDTSGVIIMAKNDLAMKVLQEQFMARTVKKKYIALVDGMPPTPTGRIEAPIGRDSAQRKKMAVVSKGKGKNAISEYKTLESFEEHTLLEVAIMTGRTHQIRLHCKFIGTPVVGDPDYGYRRQKIESPRQFLHAARLVIKLPNEEEARSFDAKLPEELENILTELRSNH